MSSSIRIFSYNVNGIRSALKKGLADWIATSPGDIICLQETKAQPEDIDTSAFEKAGYSCYWFSAKKKGYSGVGILTKIKPDRVFYGNGFPQSDAEGRVLQLLFGDILLINAYYPSGTSGEERQQYKYQWLDEWFDYLQKLKKQYPKIILCGDYNIAHKEIDIHDPKGNKNSSGFLPEERAWMDKFFANGWIDTFRYIHPHEAHRYSWWSMRFPTVRQQNKGWRIDYIAVTEPLKSSIIDADILPQVQHSDHCPVCLELKFPLKKQDTRIKNEDP